MHLSGHIGGAGFIIVGESMHRYCHVEYVVRYHRGALKDGSYARANLLVEFAESIERNKPCIPSSPPTDEGPNSIYKSIGTHPRRGTRDTRAHAVQSADTLERKPHFWTCWPTGRIPLRQRARTPQSTDWPSTAA
jgi:hypothetical protein